MSENIADKIFDALMAPEVDDFIDTYRNYSMEIHDHSNPLVMKYRNYQLEAFRDESLAGYDYIYYTILRESDLYVVVDNFTEEDVSVLKFVEETMMPMVDDIIQNPSDYYDSEEDYQQIT